MAVVERLKQESIYGLSTQKMAVVERWPLVEVRLYQYNNKSSYRTNDNGVYCTKGCAITVPGDQGFSQKGVQPSYGCPFLEEIQGKFT